MAVALEDREAHRMARVANRRLSTLDGFHRKKLVSIAHHEQDRDLAARGGERVVRLVLTPGTGIDGHARKVLRFEHAERERVDRAARMSEKIHATAIDRMLACHGVDYVANELRTIRPDLPDRIVDRIGTDENHAVASGNVGPLADEIDP